MTVLVTGATGFVGRSLRETLRLHGIPHRSATHHSNLDVNKGDTIHVGDVDDGTDWSLALQGVSVVVHLAARVHIMKDSASDALGAFRRVNVAGTERLARAAVRANVRRFVYVSSIKVNGETTRQHPFSHLDRARPIDPYGISKWEAELVLTQIARETGIEVVILRPPLVYGPGVRGNFLRLLKLTRLGIPLPFSRARNRRSLIFVRNLADALVAAAHHPDAAGRTFLVSDGEDLTVADLCDRLAHAQGKRSRLFPAPVTALGWLALLTRRNDEFQRLFGSLLVDSSFIRKALAWQPPHTVDQGIAETAAWFH